MADPLTLSPGLPVVGTLSYGGVPFEELLKSKVTGRPEWDRARRSVKYIKYTLEVDGYVISTDSAPNDPTWARMRYLLQQPGLTLTYSDRGFSDFTVNSGEPGNFTGLVDVCNGPKPELLEFTPMGARLAARIVWKCEICVPETASSRTGFQTPFSLGILAFNWATELNFDEEGYADYSVEGELEIARIAGVPENLENYRAYTEPQLLSGFKPTKRSFKADDAKRQIKFNYAFKELPPMGIPMRCTKANGSYRVSSEGNIAAIQWSATLQASYTVVPTGPRREAYMRFLGLLRHRLNHVAASVTPTVDGGGGGSGGGLGEAIGGALVGGVVPSLGRALGLVSPSPAANNNQPQDPPKNIRKRPIVRKFVINEGLYEDSRSTSFECKWTFITTFESIFKACGAWRKMSDCAGQNGPDGRDVWVANMASIVGYTSWYNYGFRPQAEIVISPNTTNLGPITAADKMDGTGPTPNDDRRVCTAGAGLTRHGVDPDTGESPDADVRFPGLPSPETSWLNYQMEFVTDLDPGMALHKKLPQRDDPVDSLGSVDPFASNPDSDSANGINTFSNSTSEDLLQRMATSTYRVAVRGFGVRAGYKVPVPDLKVFGGATVSPAKQRVIGPRIINNYSGIPIYMTAWVLWYDVPVPPTARQDAPPNLAQHIGDVENPPEEIQAPVSVPEPPISRSLTVPRGNIVPV